MEPTHASADDPGFVYNDLCSSCLHAASCPDCTPTRDPVLRCGEFEMPGTASDPSMVQQIEALVAQHGEAGGGLIGMMQGIQARFGYLPEGALRLLAQRTGRSLVDIYGVATFYKAFSLEPRGRHLVSVCTGTACHVRNAPRVAAAFQRQLGVAAGHTTDDREFTLELVNCLGACALGPIVVIDGHYFSQVSEREVESILNRARVGLDRVEPAGDERVFPVQVHCPRCNHSLMDHEHLLDGKPSIRVTVSFLRKHGWLLLSSLYGSFTIESQHPIPEDTVANFFCPYCHGELMGHASCAVCDAPMVPMIVQGGGMVQICSRRGCRSHMLDLNGVNFQ